MSGMFGLGSLLCFWVQLRHAANDVTIDLAKRIVDCTSGSTFRTRRIVPLGNVTFTTRTTLTEIAGNSVEGVAVHLQGDDLDVNVLNFTADQESVVDGFTGILAGAAEQAPAVTLGLLEAHAAQLPPHMFGQLFGLLALMVAGAFWLVATYLLRAG